MYFNCKIVFNILFMKCILAINIVNQTALEEKAPIVKQKEIEGDADKTFSTSHSISINGVPFPREGRGFYQTVRPDFDMQLSQVIGENVRSIIDINEKSRASQDNFGATQVNINDINLLGSGSEQKPKSRIVTKKGENGKEYEYEYYYYYEEDGDADDEDSVDTNVDTVKETGGSGKPKNEDVVTSGNLNSSLEKDIPLYSRSSVNEKSKPVDTVSQSDTLENSKKNSIRRPSLDLVDSESFNTNDKKSVQTNKTLEAQQTQKDTDDIASKPTSANEEGATTSSRPPTINSETTAFIMQKSALDLYAMLANENLNSENEVYTLNTIATTNNIDSVASVTTQTPMPSTIIASSTESVTLSNDSESPTPSKSILPIRPRSRTSSLLTGKKKESTTEIVAQTSTTEKSFTTRRRFNASQASKNLESSGKKEEKTEAHGKNFGSGYNRFNLKSQITRATEGPKTEELSSTVRLPSLSRNRPVFNSRRGLQKKSSPSVASTEPNVSVSEIASEETTKTTSSSTNNKVNRINLKNRRNPLLSRKRDENKQTENTEENKANPTEPTVNGESTTSKIKQRGRLSTNTVEKQTTTPHSVNNRRVNPLLRNRPVTSTSTTTEASELIANKDADVIGESDAHSESEEIKVDTTSEIPTTKPSGLAALRRKILLRQPGKEKVSK